MPEQSILFIIFLIFVGSAIMATFALFMRQSMLLAYIGIGMMVGPWGFGLVQDVAVIEQISHVGIIFLLFLLGRFFTRFFKHIVKSQWFCNQNT